MKVKTELNSPQGSSRSLECRGEPQRTFYCMSTNFLAQPTPNAVRRQQSLLWLLFCPQKLVWSLIQLIELDKIKTTSPLPPLE